MRLILLACAWLATIAVAVFVGRSTAPEITAGGPAAPLRSEDDVPPGAGHDGDPHDGAGPGATGTRGSTETPGPHTDLPASAGDPSIDVTAPIFDFSQGDTITEVSSGFRRYVEAQLGRGPEGYVCILRSINHLVRDEHEILRLLNEQVAAREAYPWISMLVRSEPRVLDLLEFVYQSMAENTPLFRELDDNTLEIFVDGTPQILTGAMDDALLERMKEYARRILAAPVESQPDSIQGIRRDLQRLLTRTWTNPVPMEEALALARSGDLAPEQAVQLLRAADFRGIPARDLNSVVALALSSGNTRAVAHMQRLPREHLDATLLDGPMLRSVEAGHYQGYYVYSYLAATAREKWPDSRRFLDIAFSSNAHAREAAAATLQYLQRADHPPDKAYVEDVLQRYELAEHTKLQLKAAFQID